MLGDDIVLSLSPLCNVYLDEDGRMCIASTAHLGSGLSSITPAPETLQMLQWMVRSDLNLQSQMATSNSVQLAPQEAESSATLTNRVAGNILRVCNLIKTKGDSPDIHEDLILPVKNIFEELALLFRDSSAWDTVSLLAPYLKQLGASVTRFSDEQTWSTLSPSVHFLLSSLPSVSHPGVAVSLTHLLLELSQNPSFLSWALEEDINLIGLLLCPCLTNPLNPDPDMMRPVLTSLGLQLLATLLANSTYSSKIVLSQSQISKTFRVLTHIQHPCPLFFNLLPRIASLSSKSSQLTLLMTWLVGLVGEPTSEGLKIVKATIVALLCGPGLPAVDLELPAGLVRQILQADLYKHKDLVEMSLETLGLLCADSTVPPLLNAMKAHAKLAEIVRSPHELTDRAILAVVGIGLSAEKKLLSAIAEGIASRPTRGPIMKEAKMILVANAGLDVSIQRKLQTTAKEDQGSSAQVNEFDEDGAVVYLNRDSRGEEYEFLPFKLSHHDSTAIGEFPLEIDPLKLFKSQSPFEDLDIVKPKQQQQPAQFYDQEISRSKSGTSQPRSTEKIRSESPKSKNSSSMLAMNSSAANNRNQPKDSSSSLRNESVVFKNDSVVQSQRQSSMKNAHQIKPTSKPVVEIKEQASQSRIENFGLGMDASPSDARIMDQDWEESYSKPNRLPSPTPRSEKNTLSPSDQFTHRQPAQSPTPPRVLTVQHKHSQRGSSRGDSDREREELEARLAKLEQSFKQTLVLLGETVQQESALREENKELKKQIQTDPHNREEIYNSQEYMGAESDSRTHNPPASRPGGVRKRRVD